MMSRNDVEKNVQVENRCATKLLKRLEWVTEKWIEIQLSTNNVEKLCQEIMPSDDVEN